MDTEMKNNNQEFAEGFRNRTKAFALRIIKLFQSLPKTDEARIIGKQLLRASTSTAANYRAACRARSQAEFNSKLSICVEEADETLFWLEILVESGIIEKNKLELLMKESTEIVSILSKSRKTVSK
jgi:four helix bundle protein